MENKPKQIEAKIIGEKGCYFLSIVNGVLRFLEDKGKTAECDIIRLYEISQEEKWISNDCFVERPDLIAAYMLGVSIDKLRKALLTESEFVEVKIAKETLDYVPKSNEIEITRHIKIYLL